MNTNKKSIKKLLLLQAVIYSFFLIFLSLSIHKIYEEKLENDRINDSLRVEILKKNISLCKHKVDTTVEWINQALKNKKTLSEIKNTVSIINFGVSDKEMAADQKIGTPVYNPLFIDSIPDARQLVNIRPEFIDSLSYHDTKNGAYYRDELIKKYKSIKNNGKGDTIHYYYYYKDSLRSESYTKISYVRAIDTLNWIVGSGFFVEDVNVMVNNKTDRKNLTIYLLIFILLISILSVFYIQLIIRHLMKDLSVFEKYFNKITFTEKISIISKSSIFFEELKNLTDEINRMAIRYNDLRRYLETDAVVIILDKNDRIKFVNRKFEEYFPEKLPCVGKKMTEISDYQRIKEILIKVRDKKRSFHYTVKYNGKYWKTTVAPVFDKDGNVMDIILRDTDITELKEKQKQLEEINTKFQEEKEFRKDLINAIAHQYANYIAGGNIDTKQLTRYKTMFYSLSNKDTVNKNEKVAPIEIIKKFAVEFRAEKIININMKNSLWSFYADKTIVELIIYNILTNALKHNDKKNLQIDVSANVSTAGEFHQLIIADNGKGVGENELKYIFELRKNRGIGLFLSKKLIEILEGDISAVINPKGGLTFTIKFKNFRH